MLTPRLECIIKHVNCEKAADIGTDHAYVAVELIRSGRAKHVIAADIGKGPLESAEYTIKKYELEDKIETRLGSGLNVLSLGEADEIIIAGMGGELIANIIEENADIARRAKLILQPMNSQYELRKFLIENDFTIEKEDIECEGIHVYNLMVVKRGKQIPFETDIEYHLPLNVRNHPKFSQLLAKKEREFVKVITGLEKSEHPDIKKLEYYKKSLDSLRGIK